VAQTIEGFVGSALDEAKISPLHRKIVALIAAGYFFDVIDFTIFGSLVPYLLQSKFATGPEVAAIGSATIFGLFIGTAGQGQFSDRFGRRFIYQFNLLLFGIFMAVFGAALETGLSAGYTVAQFFGWQWGKSTKPSEAPRFHLVVVLTIFLAVLLALTTIDPIKVTEYSIVLAAAALPLTYFPILVVANDPDYMGDKTNSKFGNVIAFFYLILLTIVAVATIPLMIITKAGA